MIAIRRHKQHKVPTLNMTSMPDLIFTVLFFFMIVTHMRTETPLLSIDTPSGKELSKTSSRRTTVNLYVGTGTDGESHIQIGNHLIPLEQLGSQVAALYNKLNDDDAALFTINLKADRNTPMGLITDIKQELRKAGVLNIRYNAQERNKE